MSKHKTFVYTETAFHHQGDLNYLKELILASKRAGADGVKFQVLIDTASFLSTRHSGFQTLSSYCMGRSQWEEVLHFMQGQQLKTVWMPLDPPSLELMRQYPVDFIDIHPVSFYDRPLLEAIRKTGVPVILGVGGRTPQEIQTAYEFFGSQLQVLMVGFQAFPSELRDVKLGRIRSLHRQYPDLQIGYADHSSFSHEHAVVSNDYARLLGATVFEKHIAIEEGKERVDYSAAVSERKVSEIIQRLAFIDEYILNDETDVFAFTAPEVKYRERQKKVVPTKTLSKGAVLGAEDLTTKMIDREGGFFQIEPLIGRTLKTSIDKDELLDETFLEL